MFVHPGKFVGTVEEFMPCPGLYEENGKLYSSATGDFEADAKSHTTKLLPKTRTPKLQDVRTVTYGVIADISKQVALIDLVPVKSNSVDYVLRGVSAILHISNVRRGYVDSFATEFKIGDIVRVGILEVSPHTVRLTTDGRLLGVVKAYCSVCRHEMGRSGQKVVCPQCGSTELRKIAEDYGGESDESGNKKRQEK